MTTVVNVSVKHLRPTYNNLEEWAKQPNHVYIGRKNRYGKYPTTSSEWCNPYMLSKTKTRECDCASVENQLRDDIIEKYRMYLMKKLEDPDTLARFKLLKGKTLGCWCKPLDCHGDVIVRLLDSY